MHRQLGPVQPPPRAKLRLACARLLQNSLKQTTSMLMISCRLVARPKVGKKLSSSSSPVTNSEHRQIMTQCLQPLATRSSTIGSLTSACESQSIMESLASHLVHQLCTNLSKTIRGSRAVYCPIRMPTERTCASHLFQSRTLASFKSQPKGKERT